jgi:thiol-disulfide isomerase/thioredoxin
LAAALVGYLIINFFASWCDPCREEMPLVNQLASKGTTQGYVVLGIAVEDGRAAVTQYAEEAKLAFPIALDLNSTVKRGYRIFGPPATFFIDAQGVIRRLFEAEDGRTWHAAEVARLDAPPPGFAPGSARLLVADLDNNGSADLIVAGKALSRVLLSDARGGFKAQGGPLAFGAQAAADTDGDGRLDLLGLDEAGGPRRAASRGKEAAG